MSTVLDRLQARAEQAGISREDLDLFASIVRDAGLCISNAEGEQVPMSEPLPCVRRAVKGCRGLYLVSVCVGHKPGPGTLPGGSIEDRVHAFEYRPPFGDWCYLPASGG